MPRKDCSVFKRINICLKHFYLSSAESQTDNGDEIKKSPLEAIKTQPFGIMPEYIDQVNGVKKKQIEIRSSFSVSHVNFLKALWLIFRGKSNSSPAKKKYKLISYYSCFTSPFSLVLSS